MVGGVNKPGETLTSQELVDRISSFGELGVTAAAITVHGRTRAELCDNAARIGEEVVARLDT